MDRVVIGTSVKGLDIEMFRLTEGPHRVLLIGGVHGDEPEGYNFTENFLRRGDWKQFEGSLEIHVIPRLNPDGCLSNNRLNTNGVDLNRNMPTKDWSPKAANERYIPGPAAGSEPETQILVKLFEAQSFAAVLSFHSFDPMINYNGPSLGLAKAIGEKCAYKVADDIGYPTPGSLGTWAGQERKVPVITYEIERGLDREKAWLLHGPAVIAGLEYLVKNGGSAA